MTQTDRQVYGVKAAVALLELLLLLSFLCGSIGGQARKVENAISLYTAKGTPVSITESGTMIDVIEDPFSESGSLRKWDLLAATLRWVAVSCRSRDHLPKGIGANVDALRPQISNSGSLQLQSDPLEDCSIAQVWKTGHLKIKGLL